jgi:hypothetical protein
MVIITDSGSGIDAGIISRIFRNLLQSLIQVLD